MGMKKILLCLLTFLLVPSMWAFGQEKAPETKEVILERAEKITYDSKNEVFNASGNVVIIQGENRIECGELSFSLRENRGSFRGGVRVTRGKTEIRALTMEGDLDRELYTFHEGVELRKERESEGETSVILWKAETLSYNGKNEEAWSEGGVEIAWKEVLLRADRAHYFPKDEAKGEEERMVLEGNVVITEKEREIQVAQAVYFLDTEKLEASGITRAKFVIREKE
jgi:lipopolysaccharide export system protein LptA